MFAEGRNDWTAYAEGNFNATLLLETGKRAGITVWEKGWLPLRENKGNQHYSSQGSTQDLEKQKVTEATPVAQIHGISQFFQTHLIAHTEKNGIII